MDFKDYYKILSVEPEADSKTIKTAYRKLARKYHPDMNADKGAEDKFKEVAEAYEVLKDTKRRAEFDELRQYGSQSNQGFKPPPDWKSGNAGQTDSDFSEFFNSMFGGGSREFHHTNNEQAYSARGQDAEIELPVFLEDTVAENSKTIEYQIPAYEDGQLVNIKKHLKVKIPQGVLDGERIRLKGQGSPGAGRGVAGDLYLHIRLVPHPLFDVQGHNLLLTLSLAPWEAALGAKITVPTLSGKINLTIAPNSQAGGKLRIKGKGLQGKSITGDLYVIIKIVMPPAASEKANQLWGELADTANFDPRAEWGNDDD
jgi:curved DNA-binding protein